MKWKKAVSTTAFCGAVAVYLWLTYVLATLPAFIIHGKRPDIPLADHLIEFVEHEAAVTSTGIAVALSATLLFRRRADWKPYAVLMVGSCLLFAVYELFGL